ncbi:glycoside hydrolase family 28 protein [Massilia cavernae]|uniref:Glycoside hydrolase family 28 protein n=1 Tax=Massilia cavernae TaxID=2320864 RepID=A0A418XDY6_9BURK|nr:glycoside hydrolase family 28 protein [Massilia cavernae]RJG10744.1 glycoside hydrolase family 28 protein [Massilia cavernae]
MSPVSRVNLRRRSLLQATSAAALLPAASSQQALAAATTPADPWQQAQAIIDRFAIPLAFRKHDFTITSYGAAPCKLVKVSGQVASQVNGTLDTPAPGSTDCYPAIAAAIAACHAAGGGRVLIPEGSWYCKGPIVLRSNVNVHLAAGAQVYFSANPDDFAKYGDFDCGPHGKLVLSRWQGNDCLNYSPMVYAYGQDNIAITGEDWTSILNGQGGVPFEGGFKDSWWDWKGRHKEAGRMSEIVVNPRNPASLDALAPTMLAADRALVRGEGDRWRSDSRYLPVLSEAGVPVSRRIFGHGHYLRPCMVEFISCTNVLMQGYTLNGAPFWMHHPVNSRYVHIKGVNLDSMGPNSDGFDPESCDTVLVDGCTFNSGDDCIAIKSGKNRDTQFGPTRNVVIQNSVMNSGHGAVTLGSEMAGGIENVYAQNLEFRNVFWATDALNIAIRMKTNMNRGGYLRNFYVRNVSIPNGVQTTPAFYKPLPGSAIQPNSVASSAGGVITIDCDYAPADDSVRTRPPMVSNVHISGIKVGNATTPDGSFSCYQAMVILGPVASSYNGPAGVPVLPLSGITIADCDFGTPRNASQPWFLHNVRGLTLDKVTIAGKRYSTTLPA